MSPPQFQFPFSFLPAFTSRLSGNRGVQYTRLAVQRGGTFQMGGSSSHNRYLLSVFSLLAIPPFMSTSSPAPFIFRWRGWMTSLGYLLE